MIYYPPKKLQLQGPAQTDEFALSPMSINDFFLFFFQHQFLEALGSRIWTALTAQTAQNCNFILEICLRISVLLSVVCYLVYENLFLKWTHCALVLDFECNPVLNECRTDEWNIQTYYRRTDFFRIVKVTKIQNIFFWHLKKRVNVNFPWSSLLKIYVCIFWLITGQ